MTRYTASEARRNIARLLDAAERGEKVVIERRGIRFLIKRAASGASREAPPPPIAVVDEAILEGRWTWSVGEHGELEFVPGASEE